MAIKEKAKHPHETQPPRQAKFPRLKGDFEMATTALPVTHPKVSSEAGDSIAGSLNQSNYMKTKSDDLDAYAIHHSHTNGKKG